MSYRSNIHSLASRLIDARRAGLIAAATVLINAVKRNLTGGYTTGDFVTGVVRASVTRSEPEIDIRGGRIAVGSDVMYALYWELGHNNLFTRRFERVEKWMPALRDSADAMQATYSRVVAERMR